MVICITATRSHRRRTFLAQATAATASRMKVSEDEVEITAVESSRKALTDSLGK